ncbi:MAG: hypothetical protein ACEQSB_06105 [Undibacterium sp.]
MTPRPYISWSSLELFEKSPEKWERLYLGDGKKVYENSGSRFGALMAKTLELDELSGDPAIDLAVSQLTKYEIPDKIVEVQMNVGRGKDPIILHGRPDTRTEDFAAFGEYKSGQAHWTQTKVDRCGQLTFYATIGYIFRGNKLVEKMWLEQVVTEKMDSSDPQSELVPTGEILKFNSQRSLSDILNMMVRIKKGWQGMERLTMSLL